MRLGSLLPSAVGTQGPYGCLSPQENEKSKLHVKYPIFFGSISNKLKKEKNIVWHHVSQRNQTDGLLLAQTGPQ